MNDPLVSVCLPIFNAEPYLLDCLKSITSQSYKNIELIAVDDCSTDKSFAILKKFAKNNPLIKVFQNHKNLGVSQTFNFAISKSKGSFIARMDADDIMFPNRIADQISFFKTHPEHVIVGGQCKLINKLGQPIGEKRFPTDHDQIYKMLFRTVPMQQPTITINKSLLPKNFLYGNPKFTPAEDYGLFFSAAKYGKFANLAEFTHYYREHNSNISLVKPKYTFWRIWKARIDGIANQNYHPDLISLIIVFLQTVTVFLLPQKFIYPLHKLLRGMKTN